jgi:hypothetical protein
VFVLAAKLGREGTEQTLIDALRRTGNPNLATDLLNSGRPVLAAAAQRWASQSGYTIVSRGGVPGATWGVF